VADRPVEIRGDDLELLVEGRSFTGWETMTVARALDAVAAQFQLVVSDREPFPVRPGDECTVKVAGELVVTGYVDALQYTGTATGRQLTVAGRDRTGDLVDCSETSDPGEWTELPLAELVQKIADPFGIEVRALSDAALQPLELFRRQPGETAWSAIERACRRRGILAFSSGDGALLLDRPASSSAQVPLLEGENGNVLAWAIEVDHRSRFSLYDVRGQTGGSDSFSGTLAAEVQGTATDVAIDRFRPLLVLAEGALSFDDAEDRAAWEASVRAARSSRATVTVQGWRQVPRTGPVWSVNQLVQVRLPSAGLASVLLVDQVTFERSNAGSRTRLGLTRPDAYQPAPVVEDFEDFLGSDE
jgi:prophage tail gpP-like protein